VLMLLPVPQAAKVELAKYQTLLEKALEPFAVPKKQPAARIIYEGLPTTAQIQQMRIEGCKEFLPSAVPYLTAIYDPLTQESERWFLLNEAFNHAFSAVVDKEQQIEELRSHIQDHL
jgi:hypothetical protein